jgi:hypothetical protein
MLPISAAVIPKIVSALTSRSIEVPIVAQKRREASALKLSALAQADLRYCTANVRFFNWPFWVKRFSSRHVFQAATPFIS